MLETSKNLLLFKIEKKRKEMTLLGMQTGLTSSATIYASQQLDILLNQLLLLAGESKIEEVVKYVRK